MTTPDKNSYEQIPGGQKHESLEQEKEKRRAAFEQLSPEEQQRLIEADAEAVTQGYAGEDPSPEDIERLAGHTNEAAVEAELQQLDAEATQAKVVLAAEVGAASPGNTEAIDDDEIESPENMREKEVFRVAGRVESWYAQQEWNSRSAAVSAEKIVTDEQKLLVSQLEVDSGNNEARLMKVLVDELYTSVFDFQNGLTVLIGAEAKMTSKKIDTAVEAYKEKKGRGEEVKIEDLIKEITRIHEESKQRIGERIQECVNILQGRGKEQINTEVTTPKLWFDLKRREPFKLVTLDFERYTGEFNSMAESFSSDINRLHTS